MKYEALVAYLNNESDRLEILQCIEAGIVSGRVEAGGIEQAILDAESWNVVPEYLMLDVSAVDDPMDAIDRFCAATPEGESNLIIVGKTNDVSLYRELKASGVSEYMVSPITPDDLGQTLQAIKRDRRERGKDIDHERLTAVMGVRGGVGASMIASILAHTIAVEHKKKALLLDMDLVSGSQYLQLSTPAVESLDKKFQDPRRMDPVFVDRTITTASNISKNLKVFSGSASADSIECDDQAVRQFVMAAHHGIDHTILDIPARLPYGRSLLKEAGRVVLVVPPSLAGIRDMTQALDHLSSINFEHQVLIVLNKIGETPAIQIRATEFKKRVPHKDYKIIEMPYDTKYVSAIGLNASAISSAAKTSMKKTIEALGNTLPTAPEEQKVNWIKKLLG